ncbi:MAG TPA: c-type cytochrome domain-containing protein [Bacteroidota bacterium]|nr:c-type cytochrome domain-containing protein [Bacteroidota bacterium]
MMRRAGIVLVVCAMGIVGAHAQGKGGKEVSFKNDIFPVIKSRCLPCHAEDNFNPSDLSLDSYEDLMQGGKNGAPIVAGKAGESMLLKKLGEKPPFGDRMPLNKKEVIKEGKAKYLSETELKTIAEWINQGAKNN